MTSDIKVLIPFYLIYARFLYSNCIFILHKSKKKKKKNTSKADRCLIFWLFCRTCIEKNIFFYNKLTFISPESSSRCPVFNL